MGGKLGKQHTYVVSGQVGVAFHHWGQVECWRLNTSIQGTWEETREEERRESGEPRRGSTASENS